MRAATSPIVSQRPPPPSVLHPACMPEQTKRLPATKVELRGKFLYAGEDKFFIKGVTYGAFEPDSRQQEYHDLQKIDTDFAMMARHGLNTVRIPHTTPPRALLDLAWHHGLRVMVGLSAEQYVGYLVDRKKAPDVHQLIREKVRVCAGHPALLCIALGNETPASIARWLGPKRVQRYLRGVYEVVKEEAPDSIVTYVNYPTTEYLQLPFLDLLCFNVYLENPEKLESYLAKLQNLAGSRPLVLGEVGLDSLRNGEEKQAEVLDWQIRLAFRMGCAGLFVFSWTDEWFRGGEEVEDWAFGLTDKQRKPKPALRSVSDSFADVPFPRGCDWPRISVVVCTYNGARTLAPCLDALLKLNYPDYEVIVVNDGSSDDTTSIAARYPFQLISTSNEGLSNARNRGAVAATGEIVAYIDDDAMADTDWLLHIAESFRNPAYAAVGGPNIAPLTSCFMADCVDHAPGSPTHVLFTDREAEHIPGCNFTIRRDLLLRMGGFDPRFRAAGDDVDLCWRLEEMGWKIGFNGAAMVWHHRRSTLASYLKQQTGYGKAEALLERKWPHKYNTLGHKTWHGRIYSNGTLGLSLLNRWRIYHGVWGSAPFQSIYGPGSTDALSFTLMPEWFLISATLTALGLLGLLWAPLLYLIPLALLSSALPLAHIVQYVIRVTSNSRFKVSPHPLTRLRWHLTTVTLHTLQPLARLFGRINHRLTPWRKHATAGFAAPFPRTFWVWCEDWVAPEQRLEALETDMKRHGAHVARGGDFSRWDFRINGGGFGHVLAAMAAEDHPLRKQLLRFRQSARLSSFALYLLGFLGFLLLVAILDGSWIPASLFGGVLLAVLIRSAGDCARAAFCLREAVKKQAGES
jgi:O-antigen biosynthesis protein